MKEQKISSSWTKPMLILMILLWVIGLPLIFLFLGLELKLETGLVIVLLMYLGLVGLTAYFTFNLSSVKLYENEIRFKKIFGPEKTFSFNEIGYLSAFRLKRLKFTSVEMKKASGEKEKYLILNNNGLLSGENIDAEKILLMLKTIPYKGQT